MMIHIEGFFLVSDNIEIIIVTAKELTHIELAFTVVYKVVE